MATSAFNDHLQESLRLAEQMASMSLGSGGKSPKKSFFQRAFETHSEGKGKDEERKPYVPPKHILLYLVRMGSFTSRPQIKPKKFEDSVGIPDDLGDKLLIDWVREQQKNPLSLLKRKYRPAEGISDYISDETPFRLMQWNILAQALGTQADNFVSCPAEALEWNCRRFRIVEEILFYDPDIICLQEVDHFEFFETLLKAQGFAGHFMPKPDSPCIYLPENNGPDGCALFFRTDRFELTEVKTRTLEVWKVQSNQVAIIASLRDFHSGKEVMVLTTHLKARQGALLSSLRYEQGGDLLAFLEENQHDRPAIVCGDFNAEPTEPVYERMTDHHTLKLASAYAALNEERREPAYSTWKIRGDGEAKHNIDYVFYTDENLVVAGVFDAPTEEEIGPKRVPSLAYPSDHFSLICDFVFKRESPKMEEELRGRQ